jgi:hypothetical protein
MPYNYQEGINRVNAEVKKFSLPVQPKTFGKEYAFPEDVTNVTSAELGNWLMKLASWRGYTLKLIAQADTEFSIMEETFNTMVAKELSKETDKRVTKDMAIGKVLAIEGMGQLKVQLIEKKAYVDSLKTVCEIYTVQFECVSREISRRNIESRQGGA